jgi:predicted amidohydrolase YtcJ
MELAVSHMVFQLDPLFASNIRENYNSEYIRWHQPVKDIVNAGIRTVLGSVGGGGGAFNAMETFVTREACFTPRLPEYGVEIGVKRCEVLVPGQAVDRVSTLRMLTTNAAYYVLKEKEIGSLEVGKFGDFVVIDRDFFKIPDNEISDIRILMTALGGKVIYADAAFGPVDRALFKSPDYFGKAVVTN